MKQVRRRRLWIALGVAVALAGSSSRAQDGPIARPAFKDVTSGLEGPIADPTIAAMRPELLAVGWCIASGPDRGVYLRERSEYFWRATPRRLRGETGDNPRDLSIAFDRAGRVHMLWTAAVEGRRRVFHAVVRPASTEEREMAHGPAILNPGDVGDADYPQMVEAPEGDWIVAWRSASLEGFRVEAARLDRTSFEARRLPPVSGDSLKAMAPQLIETRPPAVAWLDARDGVRLRLSELAPSGEDWLALDPPDAVAPLPARFQPFLLPDPELGWSGPVYAYSGHEGGDAGASIEIWRRSMGETPRVDRLTIDRPEGLHRGPRVVRVSPDLLTIAWERFDGVEQSIRLAAVGWPGGLLDSVRVSPADHRFASDAHHVSLETPSGPWSAAVWTDDRRSGGGGELGFTEVTWRLNDR